MPAYRGTLATWLDYLIGKLCLSPAFDPTADHTSGHANNSILLFCFPLLLRGSETGTRGLFGGEVGGQMLERPTGEFIHPMFEVVSFINDFIFWMSP